MAQQLSALAKMVEQSPCNIIPAVKVVAKHVVHHLSGEHVLIPMHCGWHQSCPGHALANHNLAAQLLNAQS